MPLSRIIQALVLTGYTTLIGCTNLPSIPSSNHNEPPRPEQTIDEILNQGELECEKTFKFDNERYKVAVYNNKTSRNYSIVISRDNPSSKEKNMLIEYDTYSRDRVVIKTKIGRRNITNFNYKMLPPSFKMTLFPELGPAYIIKVNIRRNGNSNIILNEPRTKEPQYQPPKIPAPTPTYSQVVPV